MKNKSNDQRYHRYERVFLATLTGLVGKNQIQSAAAMQSMVSMAGDQADIAERFLANKQEWFELKAKATEAADLSNAGTIDPDFGGVL